MGDVGVGLGQAHHVALVVELAALVLAQAVDLLAQHGVEALGHLEGVLAVRQLQGLVDPRPLAHLLQQDAVVRPQEGQGPVGQRDRDAEGAGVDDLWRRPTRPTRAAPVGGVAARAWRASASRRTKGWGSQALASQGWFGDDPAALPSGLATTRTTSLAQTVTRITSAPLRTTTAPSSWVTDTLAAQAVAGRPEGGTRAKANRSDHAMRQGRLSPQVSGYKGGAGRTKTGACSHGSCTGASNHR